MRKTKHRKAPTSKRQDTPLKGCWRERPPNVDEVKRCPWWWTRSTVGDLCVVQLDVDPETDRIIDNIAEEKGQGSHFDPERYAEAWAPCLPPRPIRLVPDGPHFHDGRPLTPIWRAAPPSV